MPPKVEFIPLLSSVSRAVADEDTCRALADELRLYDPDNPTGFDPVDIVKDQGVKRPQQIASELFKKWLSKTPEMSDDRREELLRKAFGHLTLRMEKLKPVSPTAEILHYVAKGQRAEKEQQHWQQYTLS